MKFCKMSPAKGRQTGKYAALSGANSILLLLYMILRKRLYVLSDDASDLSKAPALMSVEV